MSSYLYILTDGRNTKIGITNDLRKRLANYTTHNANFHVYKTYACEESESRRIEAAIKSIFKDKLSGQSKEWFNVEPERIDRYVAVLVQSTSEHGLSPAMHSVTLTDEARELQSEIWYKMEQGERQHKEAIAALKERFVDCFSKSFGLGISHRKLPDNIVIRDCLPPDFNHCNINSGIVRGAVTSNHIQLPGDDHQHFFFHLIRLSSGHYIALCTAKVSMPYLSRLDRERDDLIDAASNLGWYSTIHNTWSWHYPENTGLVLYHQKTPIIERLNLWNNSFRKWVIERSKVLEQQTCLDREKWDKTIDDIVGDCTFPMDIWSYQELYDKYISTFWGDCGSTEFWLAREYQCLFQQWLSESQMQK